MTDRDPFGRGRVRRLFGLDRSGPKPRQTLKGEPLHPWTIPNAVGYLRLAALPVFLVLAYNTDDGTSLASAMVFWAIAAGDYLDGILARITGQYSRMGALLDPLVDRLTILAGAVVCWSFELLPRWALALLALRELAMLFLALLAPGWVASALLIWGLVMAIIATVLYAQAGMRARRAQAAS